MKLPPKRPSSASAVPAAPRNSHASSSAPGPPPPPPPPPSPLPCSQPTTAIGNISPPPPPRSSGTVPRLPLRPSMEVLLLRRKVPYTSTVFPQCSASHCRARLEAEHNARTAEARAAAAAAAQLQAAAEQQLEAGKSTIAQASAACEYCVRRVTVPLRPTLLFLFCNGSCKPRTTPATSRCTALALAPRPRPSPSPLIRAALLTALTLRRRRSCSSSATRATT
jgi:hypothetical protein